jgi:hypothetical protein
MGDQRVQAFHPGRHPTDTGTAGQLFDRVATRQVVTMCRLVPASQCLVGLESARHLPHHARCLQRANGGGGPRARQVIERRKRRAVGQPGRCFDDVDKAALTSMRDTQYGARCATELLLDNSEICIGWGGSDGHRPLPAGGSTAGSDARIDGRFVGNVAGGGAIAESDTGAEAGAKAGVVAGTRAGASDGVGEGDGVGVTPLACLTDAQSWPYHGCEASAAAARASGAGVGVNVT